MFKKIIISAIFIFSAFSSSAFAGQITVAAAASTQFVLEELKRVYENSAETTLEVVLGSSGKLTAQIENGAPFHIFLSADMKYPKTLFERGLTVAEPKIYAHGTLVLWTFQDMDLSRGIAVLSADGIKKIAIANPDTAPYGAEAVNAMNAAGIYDAVQNKLVYGESIAQANQFIASQAADIGFTAKSVVVADNMADQGAWSEIDPALYNPIAQAAVVLKYAREHELAEAQDFFNFLFSAQAKEIFKRYGYTFHE